MTPIVDAHVHVWRRQVADYAWLTPERGPLFADFEFSAISPRLRHTGVDLAILVQAADDARETEHLLDVARRHPEVGGVVGWAPLDDVGRMTEFARRVADDPLLVGWRGLIHERADRDWILSRDVDAGLRVLAESDIPLDFVTSAPGALAQIPVLVARHPALRIVVDHLGKPPIGGSREEFAGWRTLLADAAASPQVVAKLSGLYGAARPDEWSPTQVGECVGVAMELFGPGRLMVGSDWPVANLAGGRDRVWDALLLSLADLGDDDREAVLGGTASRFYGLGPTFPTGTSGR